MNRNKDRIECAIRHIHTATDVDPWAAELAAEALKAQLLEEDTTSDCISRQAAIEAAIEGADEWDGGYSNSRDEAITSAIGKVPSARSAPPEKYEYHYDHTDCIWYRPEARNRCPSTCAQYRDGWNDAMNYVYRDGKGYRPYRRGERYGE